MSPWRLRRVFPNNLDLILEMTEAPEPPPHAFTHLRIVLANRSPNLERLVVINPSRFITIIVQTFSRLHPSLGGRIVIVDSLESARSVVTDRVNDAGDIIR